MGSPKQAVATAGPTDNSLETDERRQFDALSRAANDLMAGTIYGQDNPLLKEPLKRHHIKNRSLGYRVAKPGLNFRQPSPRSRLGTGVIDPKRSDGHGPAPTLRSRMAPHRERRFPA